MVGVSTRMNPTRSKREIRNAVARFFLLTFLAVAIPVPVMSALGFGSVGAFAGLAGLTAVVATLSIGLRAGLIAAVVLGLGAILLTLSSGFWWLAAVVMAVVALGLGISSRRGWQSGFLWVPISLGYVASDAAKELATYALPALILGVSFFFWGCAAAGMTHLIFRKAFLPKPAAVSGRALIGYTGTLAVAAFITQGAAVLWDLGHAGGWLVMTPFIVIQPHARDGWRKALFRAGGTLVGFAFVMGVASFVTATTILYAIAILAFTAAMYGMLRRWNYFVYAALLTPAIVILEGAGSSLTQTAEYRLEATLGGVGIALVAMVFLMGIGRVFPAKDHS
jgi:hypothetical protein